MSYLGVYRVAVLQPGQGDGLTAVHTFNLTAAEVRARISPWGGTDMETAAGLAWELATADPELLPYPLKQIAYGYQVHAGRAFAKGDVMAVTNPEGVGVALRWSDTGWWEQLQSWPPTTAPACRESAVTVAPQTGPRAAVVAGLGPELW